MQELSTLSLQAFNNVSHATIYAKIVIHMNLNSILRLTVQIILFLKFKSINYSLLIFPSFSSSIYISNKYAAIVFSCLYTISFMFL